MNIELRLSKDFERCLDDLRKKYGEDFELLNGVHPSQLDFSEFLNKFVSQDTVADATIDPNANARHKDIRSFMTEKGKSEDKLFGLNKIFVEIKKKWGLRTAKQWLEQEFSKGFYLNDSATASYFPYCWAQDFTRLATEGLFFIDGYNNQPPKHLTTYFDDVIEFVSFLSNRQSGACGMPNVIVWAYYFWKNDVKNGYYLKDPDTYLRQNFQKFIYRLNQPFIRIDQCAFTNVSIFDRPYLEALFGGMEFPDGTFAIDQIEDIVNVQKVFMDVVSETRSTNMFTFPVLTFSLFYKDNKFADEEFARWASDHNMKWSDSNMFIDDSVSSLSNCCRLKSNVRDLGYFNSIGGTALKVGSVKVSTINLARIALDTNSKEEYLEELRKRTLCNIKALDIVRNIIKRNVEKGLLPNFSYGLIDFEHLYNTIGFIGVYETMKKFGCTTTDEFGNVYYTEEELNEKNNLVNELVKINFRHHERSG